MDWRNYIVAIDGSGDWLPILVPGVNVKKLIYQFFIKILDN
jgi:hypothetical protein